MIEKGAQLLLVVVALDKQKFVSAPRINKGANKLPRLKASTIFVSYQCHDAYSHSVRNDQGKGEIVPRKKQAEH